MPRTNEYEGKIPMFYRRRTLELMMFTHVTLLHERYEFTLEAALDDFLEMYGIDEKEYPVESALTIYNRIRNNFVWCNLKEKLDSSNI